MITRHCTIPEHVNPHHYHEGVEGEWRKPTYTAGDRVLVTGTFTVRAGTDFCGYNALGRVSVVMMPYGRYRVMLDTGGNVMADESDIQPDPAERKTQLSEQLRVAEANRLHPRGG